jgi:hypothetical protein
MKKGAKRGKQENDSLRSWYLGAITATFRISTFGFRNSIPGPVKPPYWTKVQYTGLQPRIYKGWRLGMTKHDKLDSPTEREVPSVERRMASRLTRRVSEGAVSRRVGCNEDLRSRFDRGPFEER